MSNCNPSQAEGHWFNFSGHEDICYECVCGAALEWEFYVLGITPIDLTKAYAHKLATAAGLNPPKTKPIGGKVTESDACTCASLLHGHVNGCPWPERRKFK